MTSLIPQESAQLHECERTIERGLSTFLECQAHDAVGATTWLCSCVRLNGHDGVHVCECGQTWRAA